MSRQQVTQLAVIAGAIALFVLLYFADTTLPEKKSSERGKTESTEATFDSQSLLTDAVAALSEAGRKQVSMAEEALNKARASEKQPILDSLTRLWDRFLKPQVAGIYARQSAELHSSAESWKKAGDRFYTGIRFVKEKDRPGLCQQAIECYTKSLELNPGDVETKINLASCYVDGTADPMKGISLLKEVEKTDSNNVNLQLSFALFSVRSQQFDKAIYRFNKVLALDPGFTEAYLHLADVYQAKGEKEKAIECLKKYISLEKDVTARTEVQNYINKLSREDASGEKQN